MGVTAQHPIPFDLAPAGKYLVTSAITLTLYDYMLQFDDEIRYVWKGRKTWIFYLYILNRVLLVGYQFWQIYHISNLNDSKTLSTVGPYIQLFVIMFFLFSSDVFVTLRICAISMRNKILVVYFGMLALARFVMALLTAFLDSSTNLQFKLIPNTIGNTFEISAILVVGWYAYRNRGSLKFSALVYIQISFNLIEGQQLPLLAYGLFNPILTLRFAISLRKSADPEGGQKWGLSHFNTPHFAGAPSPGVQMLVVRENIRMYTADSSRGRVQMCEP